MPAAYLPLILQCLALEVFPTADGWRIGRKGRLVPYLFASEHDAYTAILAALPRPQS